MEETQVAPDSLIRVTQTSPSGGFARGPGGGEGASAQGIARRPAPSKQSKHSVWELIFRGTFLTGNVGSDTQVSPIRIKSESVWKVCSVC